MGWATTLAKVFRGSADDTARAATRGVDDVAAPVAAGASTTAQGFFNSPLTMKRFILGNAALATGTFGTITGLKIYEHESGGALLDGAVDNTIAAIDELREQEILTPEDLNRYADRSAYALDVYGAFDKSMQNQVVQAAMDGAEDPTAEQINHGQAASAAWLMGPTNAVPLLVQHRVRAHFADDLFENADDADAYLARSFIDDIKEAAHVNSLGDEQLDDSDVKHALETSGFLNSTFLGDRLRNGLSQVYPDLEINADAPAAEANSTNMPFNSAAAPAAAGALTPQEQLQAAMTAAEGGMENGLQNLGGMAILGQLMDFVVQGLQTLDHMAEGIGFDLFDEGSQFDWRSAQQPSGPEIS